jgi:1-acyl-sn-glycerol-3-phosphate acyltransferase
VRAKAIPIAPQSVDPKAYAAAFEAADRALSEGDLLGIFPEGGITRDGQLQPFKGGIMKILEKRPVPVVPMALSNLWGSYFSRVDGAAMKTPFRRGSRSSVDLLVGEPVAPERVTPERLQHVVAGLLASVQPSNQGVLPTGAGAACPGSGTVGSTCR